MNFYQMILAFYAFPQGLSDEFLRRNYNRRALIFKIHRFCDKKLLNEEAILCDVA